MSHTCACGNCDYTRIKPTALPPAPKALDVERDRAYIDLMFKSGHRIMLDGVVQSGCFVAFTGDDGMLFVYSEVQVEGSDRPARHMCRSCWEGACSEKLYGKVELRVP